MVDAERKQKAMSQFGRALRLAREQAGITQRDLSIVADVNQSHISNYERGQYEPPPLVVFTLERAVRVPGGHLSRYFGYVPVNTAPSTRQDTLAAILTDPNLSPRDREAMVSLYQTLSGSTEGKALKAPRGRRSSKSA